MFYDIIFIHTRTRLNKVVGETTEGGGIGIGVVGGGGGAKRLRLKIRGETAKGETSCYLLGLILSKMSTFWQVRIPRNQWL